jgi:hypothetical protein
MSALTLAQSSSSATPAVQTSSTPSGITENDVKELREALAAQQQQIAAQQEQIKQQQEMLKRLSQTMQQSPSSSQLSTAKQAASQTPQAPNLGEVASTTPILPSASANSTEAVPALNAQASGYPDTQHPGASPLSFRIGNTEFTPGGFADFTTFFRSTNLGSGIGSSFGSIPFSNTVPGQLTETRFSAQNSRVALKVTGALGENKFTGYVEADFLGFLPNNAHVTSNSDSQRLRLYWVDVNRGKWEFLGGQSWSFLTPNRKGLSPMPADIFYSQDMDTNYQVGLTWTRAPQLRIIYHPDEHWAAGVALENPEQYVGGAVVFPSSLSSYSTQFDTGSGIPSGVTGAAPGTGTPNVAPDIIPKIAYDTDIGGKHMHVEAVGVARFFKAFDPIFASKTSTSVVGGTRNTALGGGGSLNANLELFKNFHVIANSFYSDGGGRYIFGLAPDLVVRPNGSIAPLHSGSGIGGFEWQVRPKTMIYSYYGGMFVQRYYFPDPTSTAKAKFSGFGFPGSSGSSNRDVQEGTFGIIQTLWKNEHYGALQLITQASYLSRSPWAVATGAPKNAHLGMGYVDLRYVLP